MEPTQQPGVDDREDIPNIETTLGQTRDNAWVVIKAFLAQTSTNARRLSTRYLLNEHASSVEVFRSTWAVEPRTVFQVFIRFELHTVP